MFLIYIVKLFKFVKDDILGCMTVVIYTCVSVLLFVISLIWSSFLLFSSFNVFELYRYSLSL